MKLFVLPLLFSSTVVFANNGQTPTVTVLPCEAGFVSANTALFSELRQVDEALAFANGDYSKVAEKALAAKTICENSMAKYKGISCRLGKSDETTVEAGHVERACKLADTYYESYRGPVDEAGNCRGYFIVLYLNVYFANQDFDRVVTENAPAEILRRKASAIKQACDQLLPKSAGVTCVVSAGARSKTIQSKDLERTCEIVNSLTKK